jgi:hypothetical protein
MSKTFDEICNTVLGEDINIALWENVPANIQTVVQDLFKTHGQDPNFIKNLEIELNKAKNAPKPATTPNQPQNTANKTTTTPTTPANTTQPSQPTAPVK